MFRPRGRRSPDVHPLEGEDEHYGRGRKTESSARPLSTSLRSPQRDVSQQPEEPYRSRYRSPVYAQKTDVDKDERWISCASNSFGCLCFVYNLILQLLYLVEPLICFCLVLFFREHDQHGTKRSHMERLDEHEISTFRF